MEDCILKTKILNWTNKKTNAKSTFTLTSLAQNST